MLGRPLRTRPAKIIEMSAYPAAPSFTIARCVPGDRWFPWNYGRRTEQGRHGLKRFELSPGFTVVNAINERRRVLGSASLRVGYRHSEYLLADEEYRYGQPGAGPFFWADDDAVPWVLLLKSLWVRPEVRRRGIARAFAEHISGLGLPTYMAFANKHMEAWFGREFSAADEPSRLQMRIRQALAAGTGDTEDDEAPKVLHETTVHVHAAASSYDLWRSGHGGDGEPVDLEDVLLWPDRAGFWELDSGEIVELGFSDSAFARDRSYGYRLWSDVQSWGPRHGPYDNLPDDPDDDTFDAAREALEAELSCVAGAIGVEIYDEAALRAYATVRRFLRTLEWQEFLTVEGAAREVFIDDLEQSPRGLRHFSALLAPFE